MPHGHCYFWKPEILWLHVSSDILITLAYYSIPFTLTWFVLIRKDMPFRKIFVLFAIFIFACGTTHIMNVWTTWSGAYRIEGVVKAFTAIVSIVTATVLWYYLPTVLRLPAPRELETTNRKLQTLAAESQKKASELAIANQELERFNEAMVGREEKKLIN